MSQPVPIHELAHPLRIGYRSFIINNLRAMIYSNETGTALAHLPGAMFCLSPGRSESNCRVEAGFTLVELMTVAAVITIGTAIAVPSYQQWIARYQLKQATTEINSELSLSRMAAMNRNTTVTVSLAVAGGKVSATFTDGTGAQVMPPAAMQNQVTGVAGGPIVFNSLGLRVGGGAGNQTVTVTNKNGLTYSIRVTPAGKVNWCPQATCP
jgi:prepilin-type N-terminal cleavage/methylation domain-containing protein